MAIRKTTAMTKNRRVANDRTSGSWQQPKSIKEAGEEFHSQLLRHFENDRPDVSELEDEEER